MADPIVLGTPYPGPASQEADLTDLIHRGPGTGTGLTLHMIQGRPWFERCTFSGWETCVQLARAAWELSFHRCYFAGGRTGVSTEGANNNIVFEHCVFQVDGSVPGATALELMDVVSDPTGKYGTGSVTLRSCKLNAPVRVVGATELPVRSLMIDDCQVEQCPESPLQIWGKWHSICVRGRYMFRSLNGSPTIDILTPGGVLILDGVDFGWLTKDHVAIRAPSGTEISLRDVRAVGPGADPLIEWT